MESSKTGSAVKYRDTGIEKMRGKDFSSALKYAVEAQKLCPGLEDIERMILVCEVNTAAATNCGDGKDWYKILDVAAESDEAAVKNRCKKMALVLHPDKNKFPGAAEAYQLIAEAKEVLLNIEKRRVYDSICRAKAMSGNWWTPGFSGILNDAKSNAFARIRDGFKPQQLRRSAGLHRSAGPTNGHGLEQQRDEPASENRATGSGGRGRGSNLNEASKIEGENSADQLGQTDQPSSEDGANVSRGRGKMDQNDQPSSENWPNDSRGGRKCRTRGRGSRLNEPRNFEGLRGSSSSKENMVNLDLKDQPRSEDQSNVSRGRGRGRGRPRTKALSDDGVKKAKRSKNNGSRGEAAEEADTNGKRVVDAVIEPDSKILEYADAEYHDFEKDRSKTCFGEGQIWAVYDTLDAMPRFYALINSISQEDDKMQITWLEPLPSNDHEKQWLYQGLPASSGSFKRGHTEMIQDHAVFSHLVNWKRDAAQETVYQIHPEKGETWAVFKNLDTSNPQRFGAFEYEVVEILSEYYSEFGVSVGVLEKIEGYWCVFGRKVGGGVDWAVIKGKDVLRFSHRIPSVSVSINGCNNLFELDPASLPPNLVGR